MLRRTFMAATATIALTASTAFADGHSMDIVDTAIDAGTFTTLVALLLRLLAWSTR